MILCGHCIDAIRTRGEKVLTRPLDWDDLEGIDPVSADGWDETYKCEWCGEAFITSELVYAE